MKYLVFTRNRLEQFENKRQALSAYKRWASEVEGAERDTYFEIVDRIKYATYRLQADDGEVLEACRYEALDKCNRRYFVYNKAQDYLREVK